MRAALLPVLLAALLSHIGGASAQESQSLAGTWTGTYGCGTIRDNSFSLVVEDGDADVVEGVFTFDVPEQPGETGAYRVRGRLAEDGSFRFVPSDWVERPRGYTAVGIEGRIVRNGLSIEGTLSDCGGSSAFFALKPGAEEMLVSTPGDELVPPAPGAYEGEWQGTIACTGRQGDLPVALTMIEDDSRLTAYVRITEPNGADNRIVLAGTSSGDAFTLDHSIRIVRPRVGDTATGRIEGGRMEVALTGLRGMYGCGLAALDRVGPPDVPSVSDAEALAGVWVGVDYRVDADALARMKPMERLNTIHTRQAAIEIAVRDGEVFGSFALAYPIAVAPERQDRFVVGLRPLLLLDDGQIALVSTRVQRADAAYSDPQQPFLVTVAPTEHGRLAVTRIDRNAFAMLLDRAEGDALEAHGAGKGPRVALPGAFSGTLGEAASLDDQCAALLAWTRPLAQETDLMHTELSALYRMTASLYDDDAFMPVFGVPFTLLTEDERQAVVLLDRHVCTDRLQTRDIGVVLEAGFGRRFDQMAALLADLRESANWHETALAEIEELADVETSGNRLDDILEDMADRRGEMGADAIATIDRAVTEKRLAIGRAELVASIDDIESWPEEAGTLARLSEVTGRVAELGFDDTVRADILGRARAKADQIARPAIEAALAVVPGLAQSLEGLAEATATLRRAEDVLRRVPYELGGYEALAALDPLRQKRTALLADASIAAAFAETMLALPPAGDPGTAVANAAAVYLLSDEAAGGYSDAIARATTDLEVRSIQLADLSAGRAAGEPDARTMLLAVKAQMDAVNDEFASLYRRCNNGEFNNDPLLAMECLTVLIAGGGQQFGFRLTTFTKIGCREDPNQAGWLCDYAVGMQTSSPWVEGRMAELLGRGSAAQGRFVETAGGWLFTAIR